MPPVEFENTISTGERPKTYALDRAAIGKGNNLYDEIHMVKQAAYFHALSPRFTVVTNQTGQAVGQLVEALRYKPEGRGFETSGRTLAMRSTQPLTEMSPSIISWRVNVTGVYG